MTDYATLIDAETWAFIERTNSFYPTDTIDFTIAQQRAVYDRMCREFFAGYPDGITAETTAIALPDRAIPIRIYRTGKPSPEALFEHRIPPETGSHFRVQCPMVLYFHGGGFMLGGLDSHDDVCAELCQRAGYDVVAVDYRLAPEHKHPAAFDDAMSAFEWATSTFTVPVLLCGDSAGGNLAAAISHATRGHKRRPIGQILIYPGLGGDRSKGSYVTHAEAPMLTLRDLAFHDGIRTGARDATGDITYMPMNEADFSNLPPTVIVTAECDPLSSDGEGYGNRVVAAGGNAWWFEEPGLVHGYLRARHTVGRARSSFSRIVDAVKALGKGEWPY